MLNKRVMCDVVHHYVSSIFALFFMSLVLGARVVLCFLFSAVSGTMYARSCWMYCTESTIDSAQERMESYKSISDL